MTSGLRNRIDEVGTRVEEIRAPTDEMIKDIVREKEAIMRELEKIYQIKRDQESFERSPPRENIRKVSPHTYYDRVGTA